MHAYRRLIDEQMTAGNMTQAELARAADMTRQRISQILKDDRERLVQAPDPATVEGLAKAFNLAPEVVWVAVAEAMGLPRFVVPSITHEVKDVHDAVLLAELADRLNLEITVRSKVDQSEGKKTREKGARAKVAGKAINVSGRPSATRRRSPR